MSDDLIQRLEKERDFLIEDLASSLDQQQRLVSAFKKLLATNLSPPQAAIVKAALSFGDLLPDPEPQQPQPQPQIAQP